MKPVANSRIAFIGSMAVGAMCILLFCSENNPVGTPNDEARSKKGVLHSGYKGVMSGSTTKILFEDSTKSNGNVTFDLANGSLSLTYSQSGDSITFYKETVPIYTGILSTGKISIYLHTDKTQLGTLDNMVMEIGPLSGIYCYGDIRYHFFRENGVDSIHVSVDDIEIKITSYIVKGDYFITAGGDTCYLSDTKNSFWNSSDGTIYIKELVSDPGKIAVISSELPKCKYICKKIGMTSDNRIDTLIYAVVFDTGRTFFGYTRSTVADRNVFEERGVYQYNSLTRIISFLTIGANNCTDGNGNLHDCQHDAVSVILSDDMAEFFIGDRIYQKE